jgi:hypothetical protein
MSLIDSSYSRIRGDLPSFPGSSVPEKLYSGRDQADKILKKYVPDFKFDIEQAKATVRDIEAWSIRNEQVLDELMSQPGMDLPEAIKLELSSEKAQQFILAGFVVAAYGLGPWGSGKVGEYAENQELVGETRLNPSWAVSDAQQRLDTFGLIVKMENEGDLQKIFQGQQATGAFGVPAVIIWAVVVASVSLAAVVCLYLFFNKKLELNNKVMSDICSRAQQEGDKETLQRCLEASERLQQGPAEQAIATVGKVLVVLALGFVAVKYGIPALSGNKESRERAF